MMNRICRAACAVAVAVVFLFAAAVARAALTGFCPNCFNSATVGDGIFFDELNVNGKPVVNPGEGPWILHHGEVVMSDGNKAKLNVDRHFLTAIGSAKTYSGRALEGMTFSVGMNDGREYEVRLTEVRGCEHSRTQPCTAVKFWVSPDEEVPQYFFEVKKTHLRNPAAARAALRARNAHRGKKDPYLTELPDDRRIETEFKEHLCKGEFRDTDVLWEKVKDNAFAFEGDHYDPANKTVTDTVPTDGRFNLACYGTAPAKMHLLRHTKAGSTTLGSPARTTTLPQRTAMLKAITADYCGDGRSWTADGTPLEWTDANEWFPTPKLNLDDSNLAMIEAVWSDKGALCLNKPRRLPEQTATTDCTKPAVTREEVQDACRAAHRKFGSVPPGRGERTATIPHCDREWVKWWPQAKASNGAVHVVSVNLKKRADYCNRTGP